MKITTRALIFNADKKLLTVQHHGSDFWSLPGGKVEIGEDLKTCLKREIFEELGVKCEVKKLAFIHEFQWSADSDVTTEFFFLVMLPENFDGNFSGTHAEGELKQINWNFLSKELNIKPEFLKAYSAKKILESTTSKYYSYTDSSSS